jgi:hypothetical protein
MAVRTITSTPARKCSAKICIMHPSKEMVFLSKKESAIAFGAMTEEKHASKKDRNAKKMYMGDPLNAGLQMMVTTVSMLPPIVAM